MEESAFDEVDNVEEVELGEEEEASIFFSVSVISRSNRTGSR